MMVTARADTHDVVAGLEAGADDYLNEAFRAEGAVGPHPRPAAAGPPGQHRHARLLFGDLEVVPDEGKVNLGAARSTSPRRSSASCASWPEPRAGVLPRGTAAKGWGYGYFVTAGWWSARPPAAHQVEADPANPRHVVTVRAWATASIVSARPTVWALP